MSRHSRVQSERIEAATIPPQGVEPSQNRQFRPRVPWCAARQETVVFGSWQGCYRLKIQVNGRAEGRSHFGLRSAAHGDIQVNANGLPRGPAPVRLALQLELIHAAVHLRLAQVATFTPERLPQASVRIDGRVAHRPCARPLRRRHGRCESPQGTGPATRHLLASRIAAARARGCLGSRARRSCGGGSPTPLVQGSSCDSVVRWAHATTHPPYPKGRLVAGGARTPRRRALHSRNQPSPTCG